MGELIYCHAAANTTDQPISNTGGCLFNLIDDCGSESKKNKTKGRLKAGKPKIKILDSSGFHRHGKNKKGESTLFNESKLLIHKGVLNPMPNHLVQAAREVPSDILIVTDNPLSPVNGKENQDYEFFDKLIFNIYGAARTATLVKKYNLDVDLYLVFQGSSVNHIDIISETLEPYNFDGIAMPLRKQSISKIALFLIRFWQLGYKKVHLLGTDALFNLALAAYFARHFFNLITVDSRGYKFSASHNGYRNPHNLKTVPIGENVLIDSDVDMDCTCPACNGRSFQYYQNQPYSFRRILLCTHNFQAIENMGQKLFQHSKMPCSLIDFLRRKTDRVKEIEELCDVLSLVEVFKNKDIRYLEDHLG